MKRIIPLLLVLVLLLFSVAAFGGERVDASLYLWRLVNEARVYPLRVLETQGIDEALARQALGVDAGLLDTGLPPLAWNGMLARAAGGHNQEMVASPYYSSIGLNGSSPAERVAACGYEALQADELLGAMAFAVYLEPAEAARLIFASWLRDELTPGQVVQRHIFNRGFTEVGFSFKDAVLDLGRDMPPNVYAVVADFARPRQPQVYLLGNIFADADGDGRFSPAEGRTGFALLAWLAGSPDAVARFTTGLGGVYQLRIPAVPFGLALVDEQGSVLARRSFAGSADPVNILWDWNITSIR